MSRSTRKVVVEHFSGAKTKDMKSYVITSVKQKPDKHYRFNNNAFI